MLIATIATILSTLSFIAAFRIFTYRDQGTIYAFILHIFIAIFLLTIVIVPNIIR